MTAECLRAGIDIETEGVKFYLEAAKKTKNSEGRRTLNFLAKEEKRHLKFLRELLDSKNLLEIVEKYSAAKPKIFPDKKASMEDRQILSDAMEVEKKSISFYQECAEKKEYKRIFDVLISEEKKHLEWLKFMQEALELHGYWSGLQERFGLEG